MKVSINSYPEIPTRRDFVKNIIVNSTAEILKDDKKISFLPSGSWVTGKGYDPTLSDYDLTILVSNSSYSKMEKRVVDTKKILKEFVTRRLKGFNFPERGIYEEVLPSINVFPTPKIQNCFDSYLQFREYTDLNISLNPAKEDSDKGLWQMKGMMTRHFEDEGSLIYFQNGQIHNIRIKQNKPLFYDVLQKQNIDMPSAEPFFFTQKIKILNEFIDILKSNKDLSPREFFKYLQRIQKFFFKDSKNDLFLISEDKNKKGQIKYQKLVEQEKLFEAKYAEIIDSFKQSKKAQNPYVIEQYLSRTLDNLKLFQEFSMELLKRPVLQGFLK